MRDTAWSICALLCVVAALLEADRDPSFAQIPLAPFPHGFQNRSLRGDATLLPMEKCHGLVLEDATIDTVQHWMGTNQLTAVQLAQCYVRRIYQTDDHLNAVLQLNPDWRHIATRMDRERSGGHIRGPLHGIPFLVKDNIATKDRMETTAGSRVLLGSIVPRDACVVRRLRDAGAVLLGKATMSEWADMRSSNYSEGYSGRGGQARSAYNLNANPGGSSSGSAISVSMNQVAFALGTETDGSVINPAERNSVVGIKPTVGLTSRAGVIPESLNQDSIGVFGRTVKDAVYALDAIYGTDPRDSYTAALADNTPKVGYVPSLADRTGLRGAVFGIPWQSFWVLNSPEQNSQLLQLIGLIKAYGATVINGTELPSRDKLVSPDGWDWDYGTTRGYPNESEYTYIKVDFFNNINHYLSELTNTPVRSLDDIVRYNTEHSVPEGGHPGVHPAFASGQDGFLSSLATCGIQSATYWQALEFCRRSSRDEGIDAALGHGSRKFDALLVPPDVAQTCQIAGQAGYPMITIPAGVSDESKMPFGLALMGTAWSEPTLIRLASAIEDLQRVVAQGRYASKPRWIGIEDPIMPVPF